MGWIGSNLFDDDTCPSRHVGLLLGCHIYVDSTTKVISVLLKCETTQLVSDLLKYELLTTVERIKVWFGLDWICLKDTYPAGHIGLGLGCHIYVDATTKVISDIVKCETTKVISDLVKYELLTTIGRIDVWIGLDRICLTTTHVLQGILDWS